MSIESTLATRSTAINRWDRKKLKEGRQVWVNSGSPEKPRITLKTITQVSRHDDGDVYYYVKGKGTGKERVHNHRNVYRSERAAWDGCGDQLRRMMADCKKALRHLDDSYDTFLDSHEARWKKGALGKAPFQ